MRLPRGPAARAPATGKHTTHRTAGHRAKAAGLPQIHRSRPPAASITMAFTGDMLGHSRILSQARSDAGGQGYNFARMLSGVAPVIRSADWAVCHQETAIAGPGDDGVQGYPEFLAPHQLAAAEKAAGWDACDTASNHTADVGQGGVDSTIRALDSVGIRHTGSYANQQSANRLTVYDVKGVLVGHIAATYGLNNGEPPHPWTVNLINVKRIQAEAGEMKKRGVDIVVVSIHEGIEQEQQPSSSEIGYDHALMRSPDIDLVVGAHAHVVQPIKELNDGRYIVYGLGNLLAMQSWTQDSDAPPNRDGIVMMPTFSRDKHGEYHITRMGYVPTFVRYDDNSVALAPGRSRERVRQIVSSNGASVTDLTDRY
ncbi:MAG: CapA family protein [Mycobacteriales bacterium]